MKFVSITVEQSVESPIRKATFQVDGLSPPPLNSNIVISAPDHLGVSHCIFVGFVPDQNITRAPAANKVTVVGYDYGYNFANERWMQPLTEYVNNIKLWKLDNYIHWCIAPFDPNPDFFPTSSMSEVNWNAYTNVYPWRIPSKLNVALKIDRTFSVTTTRLEIMKTLAEDNGCIFHFKPWDVFNTSRYKCALYFIDADDIDSSSLGFQLPSPIEFALDSPYLAGPLQIQQNGGQKYNSFLVYGSEYIYTPTDSTLYCALKYSPDLVWRETLPHSYMERNPNLNSSDKCSARVDQLYTYYNSQSDTVTARFINRVDLELYQKIKFTGLVDTRGNSIDWLRIVSIKYTLTSGLTFVDVQCSNKVDLDPIIASKEIETSTTPSITKAINSVAKQTVKTTPNYETGQLETYVGIVTAIDTGVHTATVYTELGKEIRNVRLPDQGG